MNGHKTYRYLTLVLSCWVFFACENDPEEVLALTKKVAEVETGRGISVNFTQSGNRKALLKAPLLLRIKGDSLYDDFPNTVHVEFFNQIGALQNTVDAKFARYYENLNKVFLRDSVKVINVTGDTLYCKTMWWDQNIGQFYSSDSVVINTRTQRLRGAGFWAQSDFSKYTILNTKGTVLIPEQKAGLMGTPIR